MSGAERGRPARPPGRARRPRTAASGLVAVVTAAVLSLGATAAAADVVVDPPIVDDDGGIGIGGSGSRPGSPGGGWSIPPGYTAITVRTVEPTGGGYCFATRTEVVPEDEAVDRQTRANTSFFLMYDRITADGTPMPACPGGRVTFDPTPARAWVDEVLDALPRPSLVLEPDARAITGNTAYLQTGRPLAFGPVTDDLDLGVATLPVTISGTASFEVAWGDDPRGPGATDGTTYTWRGDPYPGTGPDGAVAHTWIDTGTHTVVVTDTWTVTIEIGGPYVVPAVTRTLLPRTLDVVVTEVRGVRER